MRASEDMKAEDVLKIIADHYPKTFDYWFRYSVLAYNCNHGLSERMSNEDREYWDNDCLNFASSILYDFGKSNAKKIGEILVAATKS